MTFNFKAHLKTYQQERRNKAMQSLPTTDDAVAALLDASIEACGLDPKNDSLRNAIATTLLSLPQGTVKVSVNQLRDVVNQARCKQASYSIIEAIRIKDKAAREKANEGSDSSMGPEAS